jgi:RNA-directed DNA polymerase
VLVHGTKDDALAVKAAVAQMLAEKLKMTLSEEKPLVTHLDDGLDFLGFPIRRKRRGDGRHVVLPYPSKQALAAVTHKIRKATGREAPPRWRWWMCCGS